MDKWLTKNIAKQKYKAWKKKYKELKKKEKERKQKDKEIDREATIIARKGGSRARDMFFKGQTEIHFPLDNKRQFICFFQFNIEDLLGDKRVIITLIPDYENLKREPLFLYKNPRIIIDDEIVGRYTIEDIHEINSWNRGTPKQVQNYELERIKIADWLSETFKVFNVSYEHFISWAVHLLSEAIFTRDRLMRFKKLKF